MKAVVPFFSILASVLTIFATLSFLHRDWKGHRVQDSRPDTPVTEALRTIAIIWLVLVMALVLVLVSLLIVPAIIELFI